MLEAPTGFAGPPRSCVAGAQAGAGLVALEFLKFLYQSLDHRKPDLPEGGIAGVEPEGGEELGMVLRAAGREHGEIAFDEALIGVLVDAVQRVHEAVAEGVGVDVEGRMDEVRDVGPEVLIALAEPDRRAEALVLHRHPELAELLPGQLALAALEMDLALEGVEGDLEHDRVDHVLDLRREHRLALNRIGGLLEEASEGQH